MTLLREANTIWEEKVDFEQIDRSQNARHVSMLAGLRTILAAMERDTLRWVKTNLAEKKLRLAISKFKLTRQAAYRATIRKRLTAATQRGIRDVADEMNQRIPKTKLEDLSRTRARADALHIEHINKLESDLKRVWSQAMFGTIDADQLRYVTRKAFADFAGWVQPDAPTG